MSYTKQLFENNMETINDVMEKSFWFYLLDTDEDENRTYIWGYDDMPDLLKERVENILYSLMEDGYGTCEYQHRDVLDILIEILDDIDNLYPICTVYDVLEYFSL